MDDSAQTCVGNCGKESDKKNQITETSFMRKFYYEQEHSFLLQIGISRLICLPTQYQNFMMIRDQSKL